MTTRAEHLEWCKQRARELCAAGDPQGALTSMASDLQGHPENTGHVGINLMMGQLMTGGLRDSASVLQFINGFN